MKDPAKAPSNRKRKVGCWGKLVRAGAGVLFALLAAEVAVRVLADDVLPNPIGPRHLCVPDDVLGIDLNPGFRGRFALHGEFDVPVEISAQGFRDREFGSKRPGVRRILSLGDSFGFGFGVRSEECYAKVLEAQLNAGAAQGVEYEVLNAGASGSGILQMIEVLRRTRASFQPDVVLASFFYVNDLDDIAAFPPFTVRGGIVITPFFASLVDNSAWLRFCFGWSNLALLAERTWLNVTLGANLGTLPRPTEGGWSLGELLIRPDPLNEAQTAAFAARQRLWERFEDLLGVLRTETEKGGAKLVLFSIPQEIQTCDAEWQKLRATADFADGVYDRDLIGTKLTDISTRQGVMFLDLVPGFRGTPPKKTRFFRLNKHFNAEGHAFAAQLLAAFLRDRGLL